VNHLDREVRAAVYRILLDVVVVLALLAGVATIASSCGLLNSSDRTTATIREALVERAREELLALLLPIFSDLVESVDDVHESDRELVLRAMAVLADLDGVAPSGVYDSNAFTIGAGTVTLPVDEVESRRANYRAMILSAIESAEAATENR